MIKLTRRPRSDARHFDLIQLMAVSEKSARSLEEKNSGEPYSLLLTIAHIIGRHVKTPVENQRLTPLHSPWAPLFEQQG